MNKELHWSWKTHQPLIRTILKNYDPDFVLELGLGIFSTPLFLHNPKINYLGIDNDKEWLAEIMQQHPANRFFYHEIEGVELGTKVHQLNDAQKSSIQSYYSLLREEIQKSRATINLLFVDNHTCARTYAINGLFDLFDIVMLHDTEPQAYPWYSYVFSEKLTNNYKKIDYITSSSWATAFINKATYKDSSLSGSEVFAREFEAENGVTGTRFEVR